MVNVIHKIKNTIVKSNIFNLVTSRMHYRKRRQELTKLFEGDFKKYNDEPSEYPTEKVSDYIWVCWWQGVESMTPLIKGCYRRICEYNKDKKVILITEDNYKLYVEFPKYIIEKYNSGIITKTHLSDLLRTELLLKYGGAWMDITIFTHSNIPKEFYEYPVYSGHFEYNKKDYNISKNRWTSFFWVSRYPNNVLFRFLSEFWQKYWAEYDELIEYFLVDYAIELAYSNIRGVKEEIDKIPVNSCGNDVWQLLKILSNVYDDSVINLIKKENWMQKLSYKGENYIQSKATEPEKSVYKRLFIEKSDGE